MASRRPFLICTEVVERATDFSEAALPPAERVRFWLHLGYCADCRTYIDQLRATAEACGRLADPPEPDRALPPRLSEHLRALQRRRKKHEG